MEAHWDGSKPGDFHIFAWPDEKNERQPLRDLDPARLLAGPHARSERAVSRAEERAAVRAAAGRAGVLRVPHHGRHRLADDRDRAVSARACGGAAGSPRRAGICRSSQHGWPLGFVAILCGWIVTEVGRQPWIAHGMLRTADAISPVSAASVLIDAGAVRHRLRHRVLDRHLLHQPADRARPAGRSAIAAPHGAPGRPLAAAQRRGAATASEREAEPWNGTSR